MTKSFGRCFLPACFAGLIGAAVGGQAHAQAGALCVTNDSYEPYFFAVEVETGARDTAILAPGGRLCLPAPAPGRGKVSVFQHADDIEGCTRLVANGQDSLIAYAEFDRCAWASHDP